MKNNLIVQFAVLWGEKIGSALSSKEVEIAKEMKQCDSEELFYIFSAWAEQFIKSNAKDPVDFFEEKLTILLHE